MAKAKKRKNLSFAWTQYVESTQRTVPPDHVIADLAHRREIENAEDPIASALRRLTGDPPVGRSALDQQRRSG